MAVESRLHDVIRTTLDNLMILCVKKAARSINGSSGHWPENVDENFDQRIFSGINSNTPLMTTSSRAGLNVDQGKNNETRKYKNFMDGVLPALRSNSDRQTHTHDNCAAVFLCCWLHCLIMQKILVNTPVTDVWEKSCKCSMHDKKVKWTIYLTRVFHGFLNGIMKCHF